MPVDVAHEIKTRIEAKKKQIAGLRQKADQESAALKALEELLIQCFPRGEAAKNGRTREQVEDDLVRDLRAGSDVAKAKEAILKAGNALHISNLVVAIGKENTRANRISLAGSLGVYVRDGKHFTKPAPNTFGVIGGTAGLPVSPQQDAQSRFGVEVLR